MKTILSGLVAVMALHGMLSAQAQESQPTWLAERITIRVKDIRLSEVLAMVQQLKGFKLEIDVPDTKVLQARTTLDICDERIENVLKVALVSAGLSFRVTDEKTVHVFRPDSSPTPITVKVCQDRIEDHLKLLLGGAPPPPFELSPPQSPRPTTP